MVLNYIEQLLILFSSITWCASISTFALLVGVPVSVRSSGVRLKFCAITVGIKKYNWIIKKQRKEHDKTVPIAKTKLNMTEVWNGKALIDSDITQDEFRSVKNLRRG